jgi:hypothetical protein
MDMFLYFLAIIGGTYQYDKPVFFGFVAFIVVVAVVIFAYPFGKKAKH